MAFSGGGDSHVEARSDGSRRICMTSVVYGVDISDPSLHDGASPDPWARSGHLKTERMALRAPVRRCAMGVMAHPAFHLAHVGPVGIRGGLSCPFAHGPEFPVAAHTPGGGRFLLKGSLPVARGAGDPGSGMPCREEGALRRLNGEDPWFSLPAEQDPDQQHDEMFPHPCTIANWPVRQRSNLSTPQIWTRHAALIIGSMTSSHHTNQGGLQTRGIRAAGLWGRIYKWCPRRDSNPRCRPSVRSGCPPEVGHKQLSTDKQRCYRFLAGSLRRGKDIANWDRTFCSICGPLPWHHNCAKRPSDRMTQESLPTSAPPRAYSGSGACLTKIGG